MNCVPPSQHWVGILYEALPFIVLINSYLSGPQGFKGTLKILWIIWHFKWITELVSHTFSYLIVGSFSWQIPPVLREEHYFFDQVFWLLELKSGNKKCLLKILIQVTCLKEKGLTTMAHLRWLFNKYRKCQYEVTAYHIDIPYQIS